MVDEFEDSQTVNRSDGQGLFECSERDMMMFHVTEKEAGLRVSGRQMINSGEPSREQLKEEERRETCTSASESFKSIVSLMPLKSDSYRMVYSEETSSSSCIL